MIRRPPRSTRTDTLFPYTTLFRSYEVVGIHLDAHLDADIVLVVDVPRRGVADDFAVGGLQEQAALPEGFGKRRHAERRVEILARLDHVERGLALRGEQVADVIAEVAGSRGLEERVGIDRKAGVKGKSG